MAFLSLILALSLDTFMAALSYETNKIKIPILSNFTISFICAISLMISFVIGNILETFINTNILKWISFSVLFFIGVFKIFDSKIKKYIRNKKTINFSFCNLNFILEIYSDYSKADIDKSKTLSLTEAISLALALSIDSLSAGLAFNVSYEITILVFVCSLTINILFILLSKLIGCFTSKTDLDFSFLSGLIFIVLAFMKLK